MSAFPLTLNILLSTLQNCYFHWIGDGCLHFLSPSVKLGVSSPAAACCSPSFTLACAGTTVRVSTESWRSSAQAETIGWTIQTTALPTATMQTGRRSREPRAVGLALPETSAHPMTLAHLWDTAHLLTTLQTTRVRRSRSGAAVRHNRSCLH